MKQSEIILSTVALTTVMMMSSLHFTSDIQAAERPAVTSTYEYYNAEYENCYDDDGYYIGVRYPSSDNPSAIYDESGNIIGSIDMYKNKGKRPNSNIDNSYSYTSDDTISKVSDDIRYVNCDDPVVTSYNESVTVKKGESLSISDLNIKVGNMTDYYAYFISNGETSVNYSKGGTFTERVAVRSNSGGITDIRVNVSVVVEQAPTIIGIKKKYKCSQVSPVLCLKNSKKVKRYNNWLWYDDGSVYYDTEGGSASGIIRPAKTILLHGVKAVDCYGKDITKKIKVTGYDIDQYDKSQKITYTVTDSKGRTTTKTSTLYIESIVKEMDTYMYILGGDPSQLRAGYRFSPTPFILDSFDNGLIINKKDVEKTPFIEVNKKYHVVGRHRNGWYMVEIDGKYYWAEYAIPAKYATIYKKACKELDRFNWDSPSYSNSLIVKLLGYRGTEDELINPYCEKVNFVALSGNVYPQHMTNYYYDLLKSINRPISLKPVIKKLREKDKLFYLDYSDDIKWLKIISKLDNYAKYQ